MSAPTSDPLARFYALRLELNEVSEHAGVQIPYVPPWALFGSSVMMLHGLRSSIGDIDVFVHPQMWLYLANQPAWSVRLPDPAHPPFLAQQVNKLEAHAFYDWRPDEPIRGSEVMAHAEMIHGWWAARLQDVLDHKVYSIGKYHGNPGYRKHHADAALIAARLAGEL